MERRQRRDAPGTGGVRHLQKTSRLSLEVVLRWNGTILNIHHFSMDKTITLGSHELNELQLSEDWFGQEEHLPLLLQVKGEPHLFLTAEQQGWYQSEAQSFHDLESLRGRLQSYRWKSTHGYLLPWKKGDKALLRCGELELSLACVSMESELALQRQQKWSDFLYWRMTSFAAILHAALILAFQFIPHETHQLADKGVSGLRPPVLQPLAPKRTLKPAFRIAPVKKPEPIKDVTANDTKASQKPSRVISQNLHQQGLLGAMREGLGQGSGDLFGKLNRQQFLSNLLGGSSSGNFAMAATTRGFAGTCRTTHCASNLYGTGRWDHPTGHRIYYSRNKVRMRVRGRTKTIVRVRPGVIVCQMGLEKREIASVVRMYWTQVKFCYERNLQKDPNLAGKLVVRWVIGAKGTVTRTSVVQTTINNERLENCILRRIARWRFPKPRHGGEVKVNYPFWFRTVK